ncbi:T9SS type A sorting domain-containing protein [Flavobacterium sp.]
MERLILSEHKNQQTLQLDLSKKASGIYFLTIQTEKGNRTEKIIKQ